MMYFDRLSIGDLDQSYFLVYATPTKLTYMQPCPMLVMGIWWKQICVLYASVLKFIILLYLNK